MFLLCDKYKDNFKMSITPQNKDHLIYHQMLASHVDCRYLCRWFFHFLSVNIELVKNAARLLPALFREGKIDVAHAKRNIHFHNFLRIFTKLSSVFIPPHPETRFAGALP